MRKRFKTLLIAATGCLAVAGGASAFVAVQAGDMAAMVRADIDRVLGQARDGPPVRIDKARMAQLPAPVQRYFDYVFPNGPKPLRGVRMKMEGQFRPPGQSDFGPMTARQYAAVTRPAFVFTATTHVLPGVWAAAMDAYTDGRMRMKVKLLSTFSIVDEEGPRLDAISRMRYVLEAPLFPTALLPGPHLRWEAIDPETARAVVLGEAGDRIGAYRVRIDAKGRITRFRYDGEAEANGRYHGAGEQALRGDYRLIDGVRVPTRFEIARVIDGEVRPFWRGRITALESDVLKPWP